MQRRSWAAIIGILGVLALALIVRELTVAGDGRLHLTFFDVGQGDAALIVLPGGNRILVDTGPDGKVLERIGRALPFMNRRIDTIIVSHPDLDHIAALPELLRRYRVEAVLLSSSGAHIPTMDEVRFVAREEGTTLLFPRAGQQVLLPDGASLSIHWPPVRPPPTFMKNVNDLSLVFTLSYRGHRALFVGDIPERVERVLLQGDADVQAEILKVAHHGSISSSSTGFLLRVHPNTAVISAGAENAYGHPHGAVIRRLRSLGIQILRTDEGGNQSVIW